MAATVGDPLASWLRDQGAYRELMTVSERALQLGPNSQMLDHLGTAHQHLGRTRQAIPFFEQALALDKANNDQQGQATTLNNIGSVYQNLGQPERALDHYNQALPIDRETGDRRGEATTLNNIGMVYQDLGQLERALDHYNQALPILKEAGNGRGEATTLNNNIGMVYQALGQLERALDHYNQALPILKETGDRRGEAGALNNIGSDLFQDLGEDEKSHRRASARHLKIREGIGAITSAKPSSVSIWRQLLRSRWECGRSSNAGTRRRQWPLASNSVAIPTLPTKWNDLPSRPTCRATTDSNNCALNLRRDSCTNATLKLTFQELRPSRALLTTLHRPAHERLVCRRGQSSAASDARSRATT